MDREMLDRFFMLYLRKLCLWPVTDSNRSLTIKFYLKAITFYAVVSTPIADVILHLWRHKTHQLEVLFYDVNILVVYITVCITLGLYLNKLEDIILYGIQAREFCQPCEEKRRMLEQIDNFCKIAATLVTVCTFFYGFMRLTYTENCQIRMSIYDSSSYCGIVIPSYLFFGIVKLKLILTIIQIISIVLVYSGLLAIFWLCVWALRQTVVNLKLLQRSLIELPSGRDSNFYKSYFKEFAIAHNNTIRFGKLVDKCTTSIHFVHVTNCSIILMLEIIDASMNHHFAKIIHLAGWFVGMFYLSLLGQNIVDECEVLSQEVYNTRWWEMGVGVKHYILLILRASQTPIYIHAGPFATLSLSTFLQLFKGATSYCAIFLNITNKKQGVPT